DAFEWYRVKKLPFQLYYNLETACPYLEPETSQLHVLLARDSILVLPRAEGGRDRCGCANDKTLSRAFSLRAAPIHVPRGPLPYNLVRLPKTSSIHSFHAKQTARASLLKSRFTSESHLSHYSTDATHAPFPT
ncbi:hypothetical protein PanWU01x14_109380, partial [Parasponia andersonii]